MTQETGDYHKSILEEKLCKEVDQYISLYADSRSRQIYSTPKTLDQNIAPLNRNCFATETTEGGQEVGTQQAEKHTWHFYFYSEINFQTRTKL